VELAGDDITPLIMSGVMSVFMIAVNADVGVGFLRAVIVVWILGAMVSFPAALLVVLPVMRWQSRRQTPGAKPQR
jgi:hypothetical protein